MPSPEKVSALTPLPAANAAFTYGITDANTEGKIPVGGVTGLASTADLVPYAKLASPHLTGIPTAPTAGGSDLEPRRLPPALMPTPYR